MKQKNKTEQNKLATVTSTEPKQEIETTNTEIVKESEKLTEIQSAELKECEGTIKAFQDKSKEACVAFYIIKRDRLYREAYSSFDAYCRERWGFGRSNGYRRAKAGAVLSELKLLTFGDIELIENEAQLRPLTRLKKEQLSEAWAALMKEADAKPFKAELVAEVVAEIEGDKPAKKKAAKVKVEIEPEVVNNKDEALMEVVAAPPAMAAPVVVTPVPMSAPKIDIARILDLLDRVRDRLDSNEHAKIIKMLDEVEFLVTGEDPEDEAEMEEGNED